MRKDRKILHFDGDSFFASVEQVLDYRLRGKPLVTGGERGAITSASIEAKRLGVGRGISLRDAKMLCPELVVVPGNYLAYSIFAERMYSIVREFTDEVEEYSIDECFADITGLDKVYKKSYEDIGLMIKEKLERSLGVTFGVGLGSSKVLAKVASKHRKPGGFTSILDNDAQLALLKALPIGKVWGIGPSSARGFERQGIRTAKDLIDRPKAWIEANLDKSHRGIWLELKGYYLHELNMDYEAPLSVIKSRTFRPPTTNREFMLAQLSRNLEAACAKVRRHKLKSKEVRFYIKTQEFKYYGMDMVLPLPTSSPSEIMKLIVKNFDCVYRPRTLYRTTGITLKKLVGNISTPDLFGESAGVDRQAGVFQAVDKITRRYGENMIHLASSHPGINKTARNIGKSMDLPLLGTVR